MKQTTSRLLSGAVLTAVVLAIGGGADAANFNENSPLGAPADGDNFLFIDDLGGTFDNSFVSKNTGVTINVNSTYRITAATGNSIGGQLANQSIQAWTGTGGGVGNEDFLGQNFSQSGSWTDAPEGDWVDNSVEVTPTDLSLQGKDLIILVTNFALEGQPGSGNPTDTGIAYWDNFRVFEDDALVWSDSLELGLGPGQEGEVADAGWHVGNSSEANSGVAAAIVPEPASAVLTGIVGLLAFMRRRV